MPESDVSENTSPPPNKPSPAQTEERVSLFSELKRRKVFRVAGTYAVVAWLIIQVASATFSGFGIPEWAFRFVVIMLILGFPVALILAWAFELTPDGVRLTSSVDAKGARVTTTSHNRKRNWLSFAVGAVVPTVIFGTIAVYFYFQSPKAVDITEPVAPRFVVDSKSIAVLPFANMSEDPEASSFFADGVHEDLLTNLSYVRELSVSSRTSVMGYRGTTKSIPQIGQELGVSNLLEGSVRRAGNRVRVTAQLIDAETDEHIWAQSYDRDLVDIFAIQSELAKAITDALRVALTDQEAEALENRPTDNLAAYDLVLKHREITTRDGNIPSRVAESISLLQRAVTLDPNFAEAWAELGAVYAQSHFWYYERTPERLALATQAIEKAQELAPENLNVIAFSGDYYYYGFRDYVKAAKSYERVLEVAPNHVSAIASLGFIRRREGHWAESIRWHERALEIDPRNAMVLSGLEATYRALRHFDKATELARKQLALDPANLWNELSVALNIIADKNSWETLEQFVERYANLDKRTVDQLNMANEAIYLRDRDWQGIREMLERNEYQQSFSVKSRLVVVYQQLGEEEKAKETLEESIAELRSILEKEPQDLTAREDLIEFLVFSGEGDLAWEEFEKLKAQYLSFNDAVDGDRWRYTEAILLAWTGKKKEAVLALREFNRFPSFLNASMFLRIDLGLFPLWDEPEFIEFLNDEEAWKPIPIR